MTEPEAPRAPLFSVVRGAPTDEELAALVAVLSARGQGPAGTDEPPARSGWSAYARAVRRTHQPGPTAWRQAGRGH